MTAEDLKAAGFSEAEASQYDSLQKAGFSQEEIIKHYEAGKAQAPPPPQERKSWGSLPIDIARNFKDAAVGTAREVGRKVDVATGGFNEGLANLLGMPVDAINSALTTLGVNTAEAPVGGTKWLKENVMPKPAAPPANLTERILHGVAEMAPSVVVPSAGAEAFLARKAGAIPNTLKVIRETAPIITGSGVGSGVARTVAPDSPAADIAGQIIGGAGAAAGPALYQKGKSAYQAVRRGAPTLTETQLKERAGQVLNESATPSEIYDANAAAATKVEKEIPGFQATLAQKTGDPGLVKLQRTLEAGRGDAANMMAEGRATNNAAVRQYLTDEFKGNESIDDVIEALNSKKKDIAGDVRFTQGEASAAKETLTPASPQEVGKTAVAAIEDVRKPVKTEMEAKYQALGNPPVQTKNTAEAVKAVESELLPGEESMYPSGAVGKIKKMLTGKGELTAEQTAGLSDEQAAKAAARADRSAKKGLETAFSRYKKSKMQLTDDVAAQIKASGKKNLYTLFRKDGGGTSWDKVAQELSGEGEIPGFAAGDKMDVTRFVEWLSENPVLGDKGAYAERYAATLGKARAAAADTGERGFQELHSLRKDLGRLASDISADFRMKPLERRLNALKAGIDADIEASLGTRNAYQEAREFAREYFQTYRAKTVGKVLQPGRQLTGRNVADEDVGRLLFKESAADEFIKAAGKENASLVMEQYASDQILKSPSITNQSTGEINGEALSGWVNKNRAVLDKYGITENFAKVRNAYALADEIKAGEAAFNKSVAAKLLNADPQNAIKAVMSGAEGISAKNTGAIMARLMGPLRDVGTGKIKDPKALLGLQNAFKDFIIAEAETTAKTIAGDAAISPAQILKALKKYEPAMQTLYNNSPRKLEAIKNVQKAIEIQARTAASPIGGGSDTFEKAAVAQGIIGRLLDHVPGISYTAKLGRAGLKLLANLNELELNKLLARAMYDPDLAQTLMMAAKQQAPKLVEHRVGQAIARLSAGIYVNRSKDEDTPAPEVGP